MRPDCSFSQIESAFQAGQFGETLQCVTLADGDKLGRLLAAVGYSKAARSALGQYLPFRACAAQCR